MARTKRSQKNITAKPHLYPQGSFKDKICRWCGNTFSPSGPSHKYCSEDCFKRVYADRYYKRKYNVGLSWVESKLKEQDYLCAICKTQGFKMLDSHYTGLNLDHDHNTGLPRGLLCHNCNRGLGLFKENLDYLQRAIEYVKKHTYI